MSFETEICRVLVKSILESAIDYEWSIQGFGMLRLYLEPEVRLHIWDSHYRIESASLVHTHPWNFESFIVAGMMRNYQYQESKDLNPNKRTYDCKMWKQEIIPGERARAATNGNAYLVAMEHPEVDIYTVGNTYRQLRTVPHMSEYEDGTVTIISRHDRTEQDRAFSYWPKSYGKQGWISAAPRVATTKEVDDITQRSLKRWF